MDEFIEDLEKILKKCIFEKDNDISEPADNGRLLLGFGLLKIFDSALKYSNKNIYIFNSHLDGLSIDILDYKQEDSDESIYIDKIFNLKELEYFDRGIVGIFRLRPSTFRENYFQKNFSFGFESRLDMLSSIIKANEKCYESSLKYYSKDKLRQSKKLQDEYNNLPEAVLKEENIHFIFSEYVSNLNFLFVEYLDSFNFMEDISNLKDNFLLSDLLKELSNINVPKQNFLSPEKFLETLKSFINIFYEKFNIKLEEDNIRELLVDLLFTNVNLENYSNINIYDPFYFSTDTLEKSKEYILDNNKGCNINLYKKIELMRLFKADYLDPKFDRLPSTSFYTILKLLLCENISFEKTYGIPYEDINLSDLDFIISDYRKKSISEDIGFIHQFQDKLDYSSKLVILIEEDDLYNKSINWMIKNDNLEAIISFEDCFILIANSNKSLDRKNKFILIDYALLNINEHRIDDESSSYDGEKNVDKNHYESLNKEKFSNILKVYKDFITNDFAKVINNDDVVKGFVYDELDKYWGDYYNNPLGTLTLFYPLEIHDILKVHDKYKYMSGSLLSNIPNELILKSKKYHERFLIPKLNIDEGLECNINIKRIMQMPEYKSEWNILKTMDFYIKDFNYNDLMYDKKRKISSIIKQESIGDNKSKILEEKIEFLPLYHIITFDINEIDYNEIPERIIERYGHVFFIKSDTFLKEFLEIYLDSGTLKEEYEYFNSSSFTINNATISKDFIYIRVPLLDIETQEKIIKAYELNEEHYNLVKTSRDNFRKNILNYDKVLKDMEEFNKMEIDINTGQIVEMNTVKRHMFDGLLWPLSISYLNAVHGTHVSNPNEKLDFYLKLFEFLTAFIDIVLISAIPDENYNFLKEDLWDGISDNYSYKATFGTWTTLYHKLLDLYDEKDIEPKFNNDLIESLLNEDIYNIMDEVREIRNEFPGHGVSISESRAKQLIDDLKLKIDIVYDIFGYLTGFKLFYSVKVLELFEDGSNLYEVVSLNGPCDQPIYGEVTFNKRLKNNSLYLNNSMDGDLLELNKNLIKFEEVIEEYKDKKGRQKQRATGRFYLYLFNRFKKKNNNIQVKYKCYQVETDEIPKKITLDEWKELM